MREQFFNIAVKRLVRARKNVKDDKNGLSKSLLIAVCGQLVSKQPAAVLYGRFPARAQTASAVCTGRASSVFQRSGPCVNSGRERSDRLMLADVSNSKLSRWKTKAILTYRVGKSKPFRTIALVE